MLALHASTQVLCCWSISYSVLLYCFLLLLLLLSIYQMVLFSSIIGVELLCHIVLIRVSARATASVRAFILGVLNIELPRYIFEIFRVLSRLQLVDHFENIVFSLLFHLF